MCSQTIFAFSLLCQCAGPRRLGARILGIRGRGRFNYRPARTVDQNLEIQCV
ncbi:hypothetical protein PF005_g20036 [Phytophthora fragariae]|uniref:Uncharacterized protein n=1 Tax=Phytophthora fragariae TaxID=53985 RepID=A0A6A4CN00_9STRA|nr:hypothetical protein PF003_g6643 [Phytophthora fragariae]KAE8934580.1 hypothetical protein PF009_g15438 [Phytophthora fragariae]KAE8993074.1 hypothetical protein PF011_g17282 [Phytophthora fragariae]KAE9090904.1 hypothetical protein PF010_g18407 [Phytophthora fragariae]KAE9102531.1 hypothetical protein PF007_g14732 [Phytophthora fragariae]